MFNFVLMQKTNKEKATNLTDVLLYHDFDRYNINLKYGVLVTSMPEVENLDIFNKKYPMFRSENPSKDYIMIFKPDSITFSSPENNFTVTNFDLFFEMAEFFKINLYSIDKDSDDSLIENNIRNILNDFFNPNSVKGNHIFKDDLSKFITEDLSKKTESWIHVNNEFRRFVYIKNLRFNFLYDDSIIYNAVIDNQIDLETLTTELKIKFDPTTYIEFKDKPLNGIYEEYYAMMSDNGLDSQRKFAIQRNISRDIFTDLPSLLTKYQPMRSNFIIPRNSEMYRLYYNALKIL